MPATSVIEDHRTAFEALTSAADGNFPLFSCFPGLQSAAAIVPVTAHPTDGKHGETEFHINPLFAAVVEGLVLADHDGQEA